MFDGFEFVVDEKLGSHHDEAKSVDSTGESGEDPRVPAAMFVVEKGPDAVSDDEDVKDIGKVEHCHGVVFLGGRSCGFFFKPIEGKRGNGDKFGDALNFPHFDEDSDARRQEDHPAGFVVEKIEKDDDLTSGVQEDGTNGETFSVLAIFPKSDVGFESKDIEYGMKKRNGHGETEHPGISFDKHAFDFVDLRLGAAHNVDLSSERLLHLVIE